MRAIGVTLCFVLFAGISSPASADPVQEAFICTFKDGKTMDDLMKVVDEWKPVMADIKGGGSYKAWIMTPIVSDNLDAVIWIGQLPGVRHECDEGIEHQLASRIVELPEPLVSDGELRDDVVNRPGGSAEQAQQLVKEVVFL